ncbi:MAG: cytochrome [Rhizobium sp.]|nr:cytochrome [Rhizobium sp.]
MRSVLFLALLLISALPASATDMPALGAGCLSCHGAGGHPALADVPVIAGQQPLYLANAIRAYRDGQRASGQALVMHEIVKDVTDADIEALANWFGAQQ